MSMELHVLLKQSKIPSVASWSNAIRDAGLPLVIPHEFNIVTDSGWQPFRFWEISSGVEVSFDSSIDEEIKCYPALGPLKRHFDSLVSFRWGGDVDECAVAVLVASTLAQVVDGVLYDPQENLQQNGREALVMARETIAQLFPGK
ncbi:MAG: hypothetical protein ABR924_04970 [Terracidiphilus sp.]|jgi:hypothetical protein